ncbi:MAG TPA: flagellar hook-basal body complex protein [Candidatus Ozemobacteraceae bacterium]|nr:flagellar hook-basal body complex protein [Candidatus Ozemobacteraceae bacterium]
MNQTFESNGLRATAYYDSVTSRFQIVSNEPGDTKELSITNATGPFSDLQLPTGPNRGIGGTKPEVFTDNTVVGSSFEANDFVPAADIQFTVTDRSGHVAAIQLPAVVAGTQQHYSRSAILSIINSQLAANNVNASATMVDTDDDGTPDQMLLQGRQTGAGEYLTIADVTNINLLGLGTGQFRGTAATSTFTQGGLNFTLTEGTNAWVPNDAMTMTTTGQKGQAESVNIFVPQPNSKELVFSTNVNGEEFKISGAVSKGAVHTTSIAVYDSLGTAHNLVTTWEHTNKSTQEWTYKLSYDKNDPEIEAWMKDPANGVVDPKSPTDSEYERANDALIANRKGTIYFFNNGKPDLAKSYIPTANMTPKGSNPVSISLDMELVTQFNSAFTTAAREQDGYEMGLLESVYFEETGIIRGVYSNGQKQPIGLLAVATFNNPGGLEKMGKNMYSISPNSGGAIIGRPATGERGQIVSGSLEMSNVDIAAEFTNMIITQRAFQANSRVITTSDELLQEVVNLKR